MNNRKIVAIIVTVAFLIVGGGYFLSNQQNNSEEDRGMPFLDSSEAMALSPPHCSENIQQMQTSIGNNYKIPHSLPSGFLIQDGWDSSNMLVLYFAKASLCGNTPAQSTLNTMIKYVADKSTGAKIS